jgi:hypothetical protein
MNDVMTFAQLCVDSYNRLDMSRTLLNTGYLAIRGDLIIDGNPYVLGDMLNDASGMNARIYHHLGQNTYVLCFRGSEVNPFSIRDWATDYINAFQRPEWMYSFQHNHDLVAA